MHIRVLAATLALTGTLALAAEPVVEPLAEAPEPIPEAILCYRLLTSTGLEITVGQAVEVCAATRDAAATVACFAAAWGHPANGGLGLSRGLAVDLCRTIPRPGV
jgi:hypothetical protein